MRIQTGAHAPPIDHLDILGRPIRLENYRGRAVLVSFYRFASCPFCNLRVHRLIQKQPEFERRGLDLIAVFQSSAANILKHVGQQDPPFPIIADPEKTLYARYGIEASGWAVARAAVRRMGDAARAVAMGFTPKDIDGDKDLIPGDFLIDAEGIVRIAYYGRDIGDHLPLERIETWLDVAGPEGTPKGSTVLPSPGGAPP